MSETDLKDDLPLMSNVGDVLVRHYNFDFKCDFQVKCFTCSALLFLEPVVNEKNSVQDCTCLHSGTHKKKIIVNQNLNFSWTKESSHDLPVQNDLLNWSDSGFVVVLDCYQIEVKEVVGFNFSDNQCQSLKYSCLDSSSLGASEQLNFEVTDWSLKIWRNVKTCKHCFPRIVQILYETVPSCSSLLWVNDQCGMPAVFTYGSYVNNRSFFPCQEPPIAMATWEATVTVFNSATVLMSGDKEPHIYTFRNSSGNECTQFYYYTKKILPLSTLCLAIGFWEEHVITPKNKNGPNCRLFACSKPLLNRSIQEFAEYIPCCLEITKNLLGPYPFPRIDFLIVPSTFGSLGMASPNIVFLSQSLIAGDKSMCSRIAHEVAHGWFGLSIGALDWTEEWLSEGFATFVEDILHVRLTNMPNKDAKEYMELKAFLRKKILLDEVQNTKEDLQILRPSFGQTDTDMIDGVSATILKNGQNPLKAFMQVHYIKGYFLLKYLSDIVGEDAFIQFLRTYVTKFEGQLVTSKVFLTFLFSEFSSLKNTMSIENIYDNWLHNSGMPPEIQGIITHLLNPQVKNVFLLDLKLDIETIVDLLEIECLKQSSESRLFLTVSEEIIKWKKFNNTTKRRKSNKRRKYSMERLVSLIPEQVVLLLENLLEEKRLSMHTLRSLDEIFTFETSNAEVQHRWFELVVKYRINSAYGALKGFLINHLAMGVYLYSEMIYSKDRELKSMAEECYSSLKSEMEPNYRSTIDKMFLDAQE